jgi:hypothetical protein
MLRLGAIPVVRKQAMPEKLEPGPPEYGIWDQMFYSRTQAICTREDMIDR